MVSGTEVPYFRVSKIKYCEIFGSRYIFEFLVGFFCLCFLFFFYSSEKQFRTLFHRGAVLVCSGVAVTAVGKNVLLASLLSRVPH